MGMALPQIVNVPGAISCSLLNTEDKTLISFDLVKSIDSSMGKSFGQVPLLNSPDIVFYSQGNKPELKNVTVLFDRLYRAEDVTGVKDLLRSWLYKKQDTPVLIFQWGADIFSPCILVDDVSIKEDGHIQGKPTQLSLKFTLAKVSEKFIL